MVLRPFVLLVTVLVSALLSAQEVTVDRIMRVGLLRERTVKQVMVMPSKGICTIYADGQQQTGKVGAISCH